MVAGAFCETAKAQLLLEIDAKGGILTLMKKMQVFAAELHPSEQEAH